VIGSLLGGVIANSRARRAAKATAVPRWVQTGRSGLYLSHRGFYLHTTGCSPEVGISLGGNRLYGQSDVNANCYQAFDFDSQLVH
jgi:acyl-CoA synthetase (AMP-forming)/AMP-acid ligase II